ncbi:unnamed protein product [Arctogadus glacialis]
MGNASRLRWRISTGGFGPVVRAPWPSSEGPARLSPVVRAQHASARRGLQRALRVEDVGPPSRGLQRALRVEDVGPPSRGLQRALRVEDVGPPSRGLQRALRVEDGEGPPAIRCVCVERSSAGLLGPGDELLEVNGEVSGPASLPTIPLRPYSTACPSNTSPSPSAPPPPLGLDPPGLGGGSSRASLDTELWVPDPAPPGWSGSSLAPHPLAPHPGDPLAPHPGPWLRLVPSRAVRLNNQQTEVSSPCSGGLQLVPPRGPPDPRGSPRPAGVPLPSPSHTSGDHAPFRKPLPHQWRPRPLQKAPPTPVETMPPSESPSHTSGDHAPFRKPLPHPWKPRPLHKAPPTPGETTLTVN